MKWGERKKLLCSNGFLKEGKKNEMKENRVLKFY